jgi:hypothetical protein
MPKMVFVINGKNANIKRNIIISTTYSIDLGEVENHSKLCYISEGYFFKGVIGSVLELDNVDLNF